jgi:uncharacterized SAM-binding protein YcdF (DUF218 family)
MLRLARYVVLAGALGVLGAFLVFNARQQRYDTASAAALAGTAHQRDTVVLTGGPGRIKVALEMLRDGRTNHVFISGVSKNYRKDNLPQVDGLAPAQRDCCVTLGFEAYNTASNGRESAAWLEQRGASQIFLVTARYHMPRAMVELKRWAPQVTITPVSVTQRRRPMRQVTEFLKYAAALTRLRLYAPERPS